MKHNKRNQFGNVDSLTVEQLREKIENAEAGLSVATDPEQRAMLEEGIAEANRRIKELEASKGNQSKAKNPNATRQPRTKAEAENECENLKQENEALKKQLREKGITPKSQRNQSAGSKPKKGTASTNSQKKNTQNNTQTPTKPKKNTQTGQGGKGKKATQGNNAQAPEPKTKQPTAKQIEAQAKKDAKANEKKVKEEARAKNINEGIATKFVEYNVVQSIVRKTLRNKEKPMSVTSANNFYNDILLNNKAGKFNKNTPAFLMVNKIFEALEAKINNTEFKQNKGGLVFDKISATDWKVLEDIAEVNKGFLTVKYANDFLRISKQGDQAKAKALAKQIESAEKRGAVTPTTPFYKEMKEAETKAQAGDFVKFSNALKGIPNKHKNLSGFLSGLRGIGLGCTCDSYAKRMNGVEEDANEGKPHASYHNEQGSEASVATMTAQEIRNKEYDCYEFEGKWGKLFKHPGKNMIAMVYGNPGEGKSALCLQFAEYLASQEGLKVLYVTAEEYDSKTLQDNIMLNGVESKDVVFADRDFGNMDLNEFDFVFLDSIQRLRLKPEDFDALLSEYPQIAFVLIFQVRKDGEYKGVKDWEHNVDAVVEVKDNKALNGKRYSSHQKVDVRE